MLTPAEGRRWREVRELRPEAFFRDIRGGLRLARRNRTIWAVYILVLAAGVGGAVSAYGLVRRVVVSPLPYREADRLVAILERTPSGQNRYASFPNVLSWKESSRSFEAIESTPIIAVESMIAATPGRPAEVRVASLSAGFFRLLGVEPAYGRLFSAGEEQLGDNAVAVISHGFWRRWFGADGDVLGRELRLSGRAYRIIGIMPREFRYPPLQSAISPNAAEIWIPALIQASDKLDRDRRTQLVYGRLRTGVSITAAAAELELISRRLAESTPETYRGWSITVRNVRELWVRRTHIAPLVWALFGSFAFVLAIVLLNTSNILMSQAVHRRNELAIRVAVGGSPLDLGRQLLVEGVGPALVAGVCAIAVTVLSSAALRRLWPLTAPEPREFRLDIGLVVACFALSLAVALAAACGPVLWVLRTCLARGSLIAPSATTAPAPSQLRARGGLLSTQLAFSVVLVVGAILLAATAVRLLNVDVGFRPENVTLIEIRLPEHKYSAIEQIDQFYDLCMRGLERISAVEAVGFSNELPLVSGGGGLIPREVVLEGDNSNPSLAHIRYVSDGYFQAVGLEIAGGRNFSASDVRGGPPVAVISKTAANRFWPGQQAIGRRLQLVSGPRAHRSWIEVIGVVADARAITVSDEFEPTLYMLSRQFPERGAKGVVEPAVYFRNMAFGSLAIRTRGRADGIIRALERQIWSFDKEQPLQVYNMQDSIRQSLASPLFLASTVGAVAALGLILSVCGTFGLASYYVRSRARELAIRIAVGAAPRHVLALISVRLGTFVVAGVGGGLVAAWALAPLLAATLYGVKPNDPWPYAAAAMVMACAAGAGVLGPAAVALGHEPIVSLRAE